MPPDLPPGFVLDQPSAGGPVYGPPPVVDPMDAQRAANDSLRTQATIQNADLARDRFEYQRQQDNQDPAAQATADQAAMVQLMRVIGQMASVGRDANDNSGWLETGTSGSLARSVLPAGTAGRDLASNIDTLRANFAFDALQAMREASKTGGALGSVTPMELHLLESSVTNLDPNQSHEQFLGNLERGRQAYLAKLAMINPEIATQMGYNQDAAQQAILELNQAYNEEMGLDNEMVIDRSANANPVETTPADIEEIMRRYGGGQ